MNLTPVTDFFSNIKDKISNPFFGTLIFVWLIRNWNLVYSIFNFDSKTTLKEKIFFIQNYINQNYSICEVLINIVITLILIIVGYLLVILTRSISTFAEFRVMPFITQKIISDKVVFKDDYDNVKSERDEYSDRYEEQRAQVRFLSKQFDEISENYKNQSALITENTTTINRLERDVLTKDQTINIQNKNINEQKITIESLKAENDRFSKDIEFERKRINTYSEQFHFLFTDENKKFWIENIDKFPVIRNMYQRLIDEDKLNMFIAVYRFLTQGGSIGGEAFDQMNEFGLVLRNDKETEYITPLATIIYKLYIENKNYS